MIAERNLEWIAKGNTGCVFATLFAKNPDCIEWNFYDHNEWKVKRLFDQLEGCVVSIIFPEDWDIYKVTSWAYTLGFFTEYTSDTTIGLRINCDEGVSWVQYFGPDSHVKTRQAPVPMLMYTRKLNTSHYAKVGWKGILHLAHAWCGSIKNSVYDLLWNQSFHQTKKRLGHSPTIIEAAKTTFYDNKNPSTAVNKDNSESSGIY
jgi:hypothetical protein